MSNSLGFPLRFKTEKQKSAIAKMAEKNNRSINAEILNLIDIEIMYQKAKSLTNKK